MLQAGAVNARMGYRRLPVLAIAVAAALAIIASTPYASDMTPDGGNGSGARLDPASWRPDALTIANLGHSTLLMDFDGVRLITDPSFEERVGLSIGPLLTVGPKRMTAPPLEPDRLGPLDLILITHAHMDHLDLPSLASLPKSAVVVACERCSSLIAPLGFTDIRELRWGEETEVKGLRIRAMGAAHWGKRWPPFGADYGFNSYVLERGGRRMLLACDSAYTDLFDAVASSPPDVAAFSIGAYDPWIWNHANPEQVWDMFRQTGARYLVPIHWGTFKLSKEPMDEPLRRLIAAAGPDSDRIVLRQIGAPWTLPSVEETRQRAASAVSSAAGDVGGR